MKRNIIFYTSIFFILLILVSINISDNNDCSFDYKINDSTNIKVNGVFSETHYPLYYYSKMNIPACNTGECLYIKITMFWDAFGNYFKYEVAEDYPLTKYNHRKFKKSEYKRLHKILNDPDSKYKKFVIGELTEKQVNNKYKADAVSGGTIKLFYDNEKIKGAVKTTHTLWHIANGDIKKIIVNKTTKQLKRAKNVISKNSEYDIAYEIFESENISDTINLAKKLEKEINKERINRSIIISNYYLRNKIKSNKANKILKQINFIK